jgi:group II intron reverse transcriptase/maturase
MHAGKHPVRNPGDPVVGLAGWRGPRGESERSEAAMNGDGKSDKPIVPKKVANKENGEPCSAERLEGRGLAKRNPGGQNRTWTQRQRDLKQALARIRKAAKEDRQQRFTALWHHVYDIDRLRQAYNTLKRDASPGIDGETWESYGQTLEDRLEDLSGRLRRGGYRARPVKRAYIPKGDGRQRPIGVTVLEDKIVQRATVEVLNAVYEVDFLGFSYGFRPGRSQHNALDAVTVAIERRKVNWVLDADIRGFFDTMDHEWVMRFVEHRVADRRVQRHIRKWLKAGILEDGAWRETEEGVPQGGSISPLLSNLYLHYALDLWVDWWRHHRARGDVIVVRYADDFIVGFQYKDDAERFHAALGERLKQFNLELSETKTRLIEFGRFACENRANRGDGKPKTFDFLGFTHICGKTRNGKFCVKRQTMRKKLRAKLQALSAALRKRMNQRIATVGRWLAKVVSGHYQYYGVPYNYHSLHTFRWQVTRRWRQVLNRRSQKRKRRITWDRMTQIADRWLPLARIVHPYPSERLRVSTRGRSPVR